MIALSLYLHRIKKQYLFSPDWEECRLATPCGKAFPNGKIKVPDQKGPTVTQIVTLAQAKGISYSTYN